MALAVTISHNPSLEAQIGAITEPVQGPSAWQVSVMHRLAAWDRLLA